MSLKTGDVVEVFNYSKPYDGDVLIIKSFLLQGDIAICDKYSMWTKNLRLVDSYEPEDFIEDI